MKFKKLILFLLLGLFAFGLVACDNTPPEEEWVIQLYTQQTTLERDYAGKDFFQHGIGVVTLVSVADGDTATFRTATSDPFRVRFLGIDTPESTYRIDPWGKAASDYTANRLLNATTIVLEAEGNSPLLDSTGTRYLAWIWVDGKLLNLELIEESFTTSKGVSGSKYADVLFAADMRTQTKGKRIWGERDPNFDYSKEGVQITLEELRTNEEVYAGGKIAVTGIVTKLVGFSAFIEDCSGEGGCFGIYVYAGFSQLSKLVVGHEITVDGTMVYHPDQATGAPQITDTRDSKITVISTGNEVNSTTMTIGDLNRVTNPLLSGRLVKIENVTVVSGYDSTNNAYTFRIRDAQNNIIEVRVASDVAIRDPNIPSPLDNRIRTWEYFNGKNIDIIAPIGIYSGQYQLLLSSFQDITFHN
jgi:endonuclease YncB( thermonuclease family)